MIRSSLFVAVTVLCLIEVASSIQCFNCTSAIEPGCAVDLTLSKEDKNRYLINCDIHYPTAKACKKLVTNQITNREETPLVVRSCFVETAKKPRNIKDCLELNQVTSCYCTGDKCNGQGQMVPAVILLLSASLITFLVKVFRS